MSVVRRPTSVVRRSYYTIYGHGLAPYFADSVLTPFVNK